MLDSEKAESNNWYKLPKALGKKFRKGFIQVSIRTRVDVFQKDKVRDRRVGAGRGSHIK